MENKKLTLKIKRVLDFLFIGIAIIMLFPIFILVPIFIYLEIRENPFFIQTRVGFKGKKFEIYKFKTMKTDRKAETNFDFSKDSERITITGKFLRRTKIDELPQLINILKGDMGIVGPRPTIEAQVKLYTNRQQKRLDVRPGMTGLAQVNGNIKLDWDERIEYDLKYIENISIFNDIKIIVKTVLVVLFGEDKFIKKL